LSSTYFGTLLLLAVCSQYYADSFSVYSVPRTSHSCNQSM
jgi:hypothetical protein